MIDMPQMVILLLDDSSLHPLTWGHTFQLNNPKRREIKDIKDVTVLQEAATIFPELLSHTEIVILCGKTTAIHLYCGQDVCRWADFNSVQKECTSHTDLLERFLQLWTLHCFPRTYNIGLAMSDKLKPQSDYMGIFLSAVLLVDWQLCRRGFQEDVSMWIARCQT